MQKPFGVKAIAMTTTVCLPLPQETHGQVGDFGPVMQFWYIGATAQLTLPAFPHKIRQARVAELVDALDLGSSG